MTKNAIVLLVSAWLIGTSDPTWAEGLSPEEAASRMTVPDGFEVRAVASEPLVRQPVCIEFDDRGRLWVIQYLQYPNPEGLKRIQVDRYSRTKYDRVPEPPPHGPRGADRITILSDTNGDGRFDEGRDFINGLNLATGLAFGHGGVFVLNVPYLLFYPDRNRDDVPDSDPEVLLTGFGMEDAHSVANSLTWGPDGWLYGCQGSTVTANIRGIEFQQGVWRYHPQTREFELFCEGGGNSWGLDFDRVGQLYYSTNYGGHVLLHGVQGGYFVKSFAKHGALHNPFAYGYFDHAPHQNFRGGHVTVGGIIYQGDSFPDSFRGQYISGDLLGHGVYWHKITPRGSTVGTSHGGELLVSNDNWFAPTDVTMGPDGAVYVSDWHDARTAHPDPDADWDRSNGRIYRISAKGTPQLPSIDFAKLSTTELLKRLTHRNQWYVRRARMELTNRGEGHESLTTSLASPDELVALESLWALNAIGGFNEHVAEGLLKSVHAAVRGWTVRLLGDTKSISAEMAHRLDKFAETEPSVQVRQQLAATTARFPAAQALPMINANINRDIDNDDPFIPLLWWWSIEHHSVSGRQEVMRRFLRPSLWKSRLGRETLLPRLIRRYTAEGTSEGLDCVAQLVKAAPDDASRDTLWQPILLGCREIPRETGSAERQTMLREHELTKLVLARWQARPDDITLTQLALALGDRTPFERIVRETFDSKTETSARIILLGILADVAEPSLVEPLLTLINSDQPLLARQAALKTVARIEDPRVASALIAAYQSHASEGLKPQIRDALLGRKTSARAWLTAVDQGDIAAKETPQEQLQRIALFEDPAMDELIKKHWGQLGVNRGEKLAEARRLSNDIRASSGNLTVGQAVFKKHCATCHQLFGEGTKLGPDLTTANRKDRDFMLISLVDPSSAIRKEYTSFIVQTRDGRILTGLAISRDNSGITLVNAKSEKTMIAANDIDELRESPISLMPDDLYRQLKPQELRDLFSYLESNAR
ncbi:PVC-type heme-binding CxxCH protein [Schlesneria paludicola]|uniref:PVC-type heme-binding CxxCH protein n=1 Tax=Schlesneria paludicola TaxID=360056 RepID=UPI000299D5C7|nr:PVC-type heme-binding CxxCH protein [Schlesneria paludicola]